MAEPVLVGQIRHTCIRLVCVSDSPRLIHHHTVVPVVPVAQVVQRVPWDQAGLPVQSGLVSPSFLGPPEPPEENNQVSQLNRLLSARTANHPLQEVR